MMKLFKQIPFIAGVLLLLSACCRGGLACPENMYVLQNGINFHNFSASEIYSVKIKEYWAGSNFTTVMDSVGYAVIYEDSVDYFVNFDSVQTVGPDTAMNILIYCPFDSLTYKITGISHQALVCNKCLGHITYGSELGAYKVNGVPGALRYGQGVIMVSK
jgi:hypothetical protein